MFEILEKISVEWWHILVDSSFYVLLGITIAGLLRATLNPDTVAKHLGRGRYMSVIKAALLGVPLPL
ncbi:MAG: hypothetical protein OEL83_10150 [Desulforhopalus sp.]|nr:hypothetical protein [Desulforhopalus sp.]